MEKIKKRSGQILIILVIGLIITISVLSSQSSKEERNVLLRLEALEAKVTGLQTALETHNHNGVYAPAIHNHNALYAQLEHVHEWTDLPATLPDHKHPPDYDSGWVTAPMNENIRLWHNLGTTNLLVYVYGRWHGQIIHQRAIGWETHTGASGESFSEGLAWYGGNTLYIDLYRRFGDLMWEEVRALIWKIE